ncbi:MAG: tetratricopeptide repeat protein [Marinibacterium sp.]
MRPLIAALVVAPFLAPTVSLAAGGDSATKPYTPPKATETTKNCYSERQWDPEINKYVRFSAKVNGVWDAKIKKCIRPDKTSSLDGDTLYQAVRELAYAGRYDDAQKVLAGMEQEDDRVLTYWGFTHRKLGNIAKANAYYTRAIAKNPDNLLARSYMGQGFVAEGRIDAAADQWTEIMRRGGEGTWAEASLRDAIRTGVTYSY